MFNKDLLLLDLEMTGTDANRHEIIQIAAILLDKKTLKEKSRFSSFIKPKHWSRRDPEAMAICNISWEQVKNAPTLTSVLKKFTKQFGNNLIPTNYGGNIDFTFLPTAYKKAKIKYPFDYHTLNLWPLSYIYMAKRKKLINKKRFAGFRLEDIAEDLHIKVPLNRHDAMVDCELEAEILRKLVKALKV